MSNYTVIIGNKGQQVASTNFWESPFAAQGFFYLTWNAGAARLLVPASESKAIAEMKTAEYVVISRGSWNGKDALELMFEDKTEAPYSINIVAELTDRLLPEGNQGGGFVVTVWTQDGQQAEFKGKYRTVSQLPCLAEWREH